MRILETEKSSGLSECDQKSYGLGPPEVPEIQSSPETKKGPKCISDVVQLDGIRDEGDNDPIEYPGDVIGGTEKIRSRLTKNRTRFPSNEMAIDVGWPGTITNSGVSIQVLNEPTVSVLWKNDITADVDVVSFIPTKKVRNVPNKIVHDGNACGVENSKIVTVERTVNVVGAEIIGRSVLVIAARATSFAPQPRDCPNPWLVQ